MQSIRTDFLAIKRIHVSAVSWSHNHIKENKFSITQINYCLEPLRKQIGFCLPKYTNLERRLFRNQIDSSCIFIKLKSTVSISSSDPPCKDGNARFTTVPLPPSSDPDLHLQ